MKTKCLAIGIIFLFVGVTIAPTISFNTVKASTDDDLVEVTTQACGIQGYRDTTSGQCAINGHAHRSANLLAIDAKRKIIIRRYFPQQEFISCNTQASFNIQTNRSLLPFAEGLQFS